MKNAFVAPKRVVKTLAFIFIIWYNIKKKIPDTDNIKGPNKIRITSFNMKLLAHKPRFWLNMFTILSKN